MFLFPAISDMLYMLLWRNTEGYGIIQLDEVRVDIFHYLVDLGGNYFHGAYQRKSRRDLSAFLSS